MGETLHKRGIGKNTSKKIVKENYCSTVKNELSGIANSSKTYSSDIYSILKYVSFPPRTGFKPQLIVRKPINSPVLSLTLLQIYCIGLIRLIPQFFWVWATICDPTKTYLKLIIYVMPRRFGVIL